MKRFLLSIVALVITSVCFAQDIIVQKDGSTIQAKVLKVSQSEVEYKKFGNLEGPTYTISTRDLQCINYENGTKDTFVSANYNPNIVTNETATQFSNDEQLLKLYNNANDKKYLKPSKTLKTAGWISGGTLIAAGLVFFFLQPIDGLGATGDTSDPLVGEILCGSGVVIGGSLLITSYALRKKYERMNALSLYDYQFNISPNSNLMVGVDLLKDNTMKNQTIGLGVRYNF